jgi:hypothetical protein
MMLHSAIRWPDIADASLWPMAVAQAVYLCNHVPNPETGLSAHDLFTKTRWEQSKFQTYNLQCLGLCTLRLKKRQSPTARSHLNPDSGTITVQFRDSDVFSTIGSPQSRPSPTHSPTFTRLSDLSFFKTRSTSIRSTTTISWMPSISRFRRH